MNTEDEADAGAPPSPGPGRPATTTTATTTTTTTTTSISLSSDTRPKAAAARSNKTHEIYSGTIKTPSFAYAHLELITTSRSRGAAGADAGAGAGMDGLGMRALLTDALKQFLGATGAAMSIDMLKVDDGGQCWLRVPRQDLGALAAAITAWPGSGPAAGFVIHAAGDWLGALVGRHEQRRLWGGEVL